MWMIGEETMTEILRCPKCGKQALYYRVDKSIRCNRCGYDSAMTPAKQPVQDEGSPDGTTV
jgi:ribosomal protein L37AE/L43A